MLMECINGSGYDNRDSDDVPPSTCAGGAAGANVATAPGGAPDGGAIAPAMYSAGIGPGGAFTLATSDGPTSYTSA